MSLLYQALPGASIKTAHARGQGAQHLGQRPRPKGTHFRMHYINTKKYYFLFPGIRSPGSDYASGVTAAQVRTRSTGPRASPPAQVKHPTASLHQYKQVLFFVSHHLIPWLRGNLFGRSSQGP